MAQTELHRRLHLIAGAHSYRRIGDLTGTHPETVRRYMQGKAPSAAFLCSMCEVFDISAEWLLAGRGPARRRDMHSAALHEAGPCALLGAIASTVGRALERLDRVEASLKQADRVLEASYQTASRASAHETADPEALRATKKTRVQKARSLLAS
ncbi:MAG: hypothetical protein AAFP26_01545 [Planctomycetota bacterium]